MDVHSTTREERAVMRVARAANLVEEPRDGTRVVHCGNAPFGGRVVAQVDAEEVERELNEATRGVGVVTVA